MKVMQKFSSALPGTRLPAPRTTTRTSQKPDRTTRGCTAITAFRPTGARDTPTPHTPAIQVEARVGYRLGSARGDRRRSCVPDSVLRWVVEASRPAEEVPDLRVKSHA